MPFFFPHRVVSCSPTLKPPERALTIHGEPRSLISQYSSLCCIISYINLLYYPSPLV